MKVTAAIAILSAVVVLTGAPLSYGRIDISPSHPEFRERSSCSDYLRMLTPMTSRKLAIADDLACELRSIGQRRFEQQNKRISEIQSSGVAIEDAHDGLIRFDNALAERQFEELHDLLPQDELDSLMGEYFQRYSFERLLDPLVGQWLSITTAELAAMAELHVKYQSAMATFHEKYLPQSLASPADKQSRLVKESSGGISFSGNFSPEVEAKLRELAQLEARRWSAISEKKLGRCFEKIGFITRNETLADYLIRHPDKSEIYLEELPAFAIARLRADADAQRSR